MKQKEMQKNQLGGCCNNSGVTRWWSQSGNGRDGERCLDSAYILKLEPRKFDDGLNVENEEMRVVNY